MRMVRRLMLGAAVVFAVSNVAFSYETYGPVKRGDTLWGIAMKHRPSKRTNIFEMIKAIRALNPSAFRGEVLKQGVDLKLPVTVEEIRAAVHGDGHNNQAQSAPAAQPQNQVPAVTTKPQAPKDATQKSLPAAEVTHQQQAVARRQPQLAETSLAPGATRIAPVAEQHTAPVAQSVTPSATPSEAQHAGFSIWSWVWFAVILGLLGYIWHNRRRLFASFQVGNDVAARRLGLNRAEPSVQAYKTETLWKEKKPAYGRSTAPGAGEGDAMADAMIEMAEGHYDAARDTLLKAITLDPHNLELRMKILDVFVALGDSEGYKKESDYILEHMISENDPRWNRIRSTYLRKWAYDQG